MGGGLPEGRSFDIYHVKTSNLLSQQGGGGSKTRGQKGRQRQPVVIMKAAMLHHICPWIRGVGRESELKVVRERERESEQAGGTWRLHFEQDVDGEWRVSYSHEDKGALITLTRCPSRDTTIRAA